jgi:hypothetical protein
VKMSMMRVMMESGSGYDGICARLGES